MERATDYFEDRLEALAPGRLVMHLGCADGEHVFNLAEVAIGSEGVSQDNVVTKRLQLEALKSDTSNVGFIARPLNRTGIGGSNYDVVYLTEASKHHDYEGILDEARRLAGSAGVVLVFEKDKRAIVKLINRFPWAKVKTFGVWRKAWVVEIVGEALA